MCWVTKIQTWVQLIIIIYKSSEKNLNYRIWWARKMQKLAICDEQEKLKSLNLISKKSQKHKNFRKKLDICFEEEKFDEEENFPNSNLMSKITKG